MTRKYDEAASSCHYEASVRELASDRKFAVAYLKEALAELDDPAHQASGLLALRKIAEAYGGLSYVASEAGISREALYRALSPKGNPTLRTLRAILGVLGMRLSVVPAPRSRA